MGALRSPNLDFLQGEPAPPPGAPPGEGPHLSHVLQQADVDGDQAREALVGKTQAFHKEQQLRRAARVLDHVVELPPAQDVDTERGPGKRYSPLALDNQHKQLQHTTASIPALHGLVT